MYIGDLLIETTDNHPFYVEDKGWVFADELRVGDKLQKADGSNLKIDKVEYVLLDEPVMVYNFTVADFHTYYVTDLGIWVHNTQCSWTPHGYKHFANKNMSWKDVVKSTKSGPAKYLHGTDVQELERNVWTNGQSVTNGKPWKVMKFNKVIGASEGAETRYVRVEFSGNTIHGHPISEIEFKKLKK